MEAPSNNKINNRGSITYFTAPTEWTKGWYNPNPNIFFVMRDLDLFRLSLCLNTSNDEHTMMILPPTVASTQPLLPHREQYGITNPQ
jgi:hypothetical protein